MADRYTLEDFRTALANSIGPMWWAFNGPGRAGYSDLMAMREAAINRWIRAMPEDEDSRILRMAYRDLEALGHFRFDDEGCEDDE